MATNYPTNLDGWTDRIASDPIMAQDFNNLQDAIAALQSKVGADVSATDLTLDYQVNNFIAASTCLYFYEDTAPTGWTATVVAGDYVLGVVASSGTYNVAGGTKIGTWDLAADIGSDTHNHIWLYYSGYLNWTYDSGGTPVQYGTPSVNIGKHVPSFLCYIHSKNTSKERDTNQSCYDETCYADTDNHTHTFTPGWRPNAAVGIIAYYSGP